MVRTLKTPAKSRAQANIIQFLVKADDDPNARDADGATPLHRAVRTRCADAASALLVNGADARTRNNSGQLRCTLPFRIPAEAAPVRP